MEGLLKTIIDQWLVPAIVMSIFWGIRGVFLFGRKPSWRNRLFWSTYQFIFNSVASMAGWCCLYALAVRAHARLPELRGFNFGDILLFIFSLLGLTGHIPQIFYGFVISFEKLGEAVTKKIVNTDK